MLADHQGSIRQIVDNTGSLLNQITYDSYGNITGQTNSSVTFRFGYTGREWDGETGQYYYRARYYDARVGRFISTDRYVFNSPTNFTDPSGLLSINPLDFTTFSMASPLLDRIGVDTSAFRSRFNIRFDAGEGQGESAQRYWANRVINDCLPWYDRAGSFVAGSFASLWTNGSSDATFATLTTALSVARPAAKLDIQTIRNGFGQLAQNLKNTTLFNPKTPLWRAVKDSELQDILNTNQFRNIPGLESKYFATTEQAAASYAKQAVNGFKDPPYTIVQTSIPKKLVTSEMRLTVDNDVTSIVLPDRLLPNLAPPKALPYMPIPKRQ
jgi:RHS repeat-associated protein